MRQVLLILFLIPLAAMAQPEIPEVEELLEQYTEEEPGELEDVMEQYQNYLDYRLNLNTATEDQLRELRMLTEQQLCELLAYRKRYGLLLSVYELQAVRFFDIEAIYKILPYVTVQQQQKQQLSLDKMLSRGRSSLMLRYSRILEQQNGYQQASTNPYNGSPYRLYARYKFQFRDKLSIGITGEKDPGETFLKDPQQHGFDFYSAHLFYRPGNAIQAVVLGDYEIKIGQGLIIWNGFGYGKTADPLFIRKSGNVLKPYTSVDENRFLRGAATTLKFRNVYFTTFLSHKNIDATVSAADEEGNPTAVSALINTGFHRTASEMRARNSIQQSVAGANIKWRLAKMDIGFTATHTALSVPLEVKDVAYNYYKFSGRSITNAGLDYTFVHKSIVLFGETAISANGGIATLNGITTKLDHKTSISVLHRYYEKDYHTFFGSAFSESSGIGNENGIFAGINSAISKKVRIQGYLDLFKNPWLKYLVDAPSSGADYMGRIVFAPNRKTEMYLQVKWEQKQKNEVDNITPVDQLVSHIKKGIRINITHQPQPQIKLRSRAEFSFYTDENGTDEKGFLIYQDVSYQFLKIPVKISLRYALFDTDSWNTRMYAYEQDVLYAFSIPVYHEKGARYYFVANYKINRSVELWGKIAQFYYPERETFGTGRDAIEGNKKTDMKLQMRLKF